VQLRLKFWRWRRSRCSWPWLRSGRSCSSDGPSHDTIRDRRGRPASHAGPARTVAGRLLWGASSEAYYRVDRLLRQLADPNLHDIPGNLPFRVEMWDGEHLRLGRGRVDERRDRACCARRGVCKLSWPAVYVAEWSAGHTAALAGRIELRLSRRPHALTSTASAAQSFEESGNGGARGYRQTR
jgi:hypothetical protein